MGVIGDPGAEKLLKQPPPQKKVGPPQPPG